MLKAVKLKVLIDSARWTQAAPNSYAALIISSLPLKYLMTSGNRYIIAWRRGLYDTGTVWKICRCKRKQDSREAWKKERLKKPRAHAVSVEQKSISQDLRFARFGGHLKQHFWVNRLTDKSVALFYVFDRSFEMHSFFHTRIFFFRPWWNIVLAVVCI